LARSDDASAGASAAAAPRAIASGADGATAASDDEEAEGHHDGSSGLASAESVIDFAPSQLPPSPELHTARKFTEGPHDRRRRPVAASAVVVALRFHQIHLV